MSLYDSVMGMRYRRMDTMEIARALQIPEAQACQLLREAKTYVRNISSATSIRPTPPGPSPGALPSAFGPGGNPTREPTA